MLKQKFLLSILSKFLIQGLQIGGSIVVARIAGPSVLGTVAFGLAYANTFSFLGNLGFGSAHIKLISAAGKEDVGDYFSTFKVIRIVLSLIYFVAAMLFFFIQKGILDVTFESVTHERVIPIFVVYGAVNVFLGTYNLSFSGLTLQAKRDTVHIIRVFIHQLLRVAIVFFGYRALALALGNVFSIILVVPLAMYLFKDIPKGKFRKDLLPAYKNIAKPMVLFNAASTVRKSGGKVFLQFLTNSLQLGLYTAALKVTGVFHLIEYSVGNLFFPTFSKAFKKGDKEYVHDIVLRYFKINIAISLPLLMIIVIYSEAFVKLLLGDEYLLSASMMPILLLAMFFKTLFIPFGNVISGNGWFKTISRVLLSNTILLFFFIFIFSSPKVLDLGGKGLALSVLFSETLLGMTYYFYSRKIVRINLSKNFLALAIMLIINASIYGGSLLFNEINKTVFLLIMLLLNGGIVGLFQLLSKEDISLLRNMISIKKLKNYIKKEL